MQTELNQFFAEQDACQIPTKSAFCQARKKIKNVFFFDFFKQSYQVFYRHVNAAKLFKGYHLWACDTTTQKLPDNKETRKLGTHTNQAKTVASVKIMTYYDVLNQIIVRASISDKRKADLRCVQGSVLDIPTNVISIYDRGFTSLLLPFLHSHFGSKFVIRASTTFSKSVVAFMQSNETDIVVNEKLTQKCFWELAKMGIRKSQHDTVAFRLVKIMLPTGETEVLMTNLDADFTIEDLNLIYQNRWGVETSYNYLKNTLMLGTFSGYSQKAIVQDIYCALIAFNLQTIIQYDCLPALEKINVKRKKSYKINRNISAGTVRDYIKKILLNQAQNWVSKLQKAQKLILKSLEKVKKTSKERERKLLRCNDRHHTEYNYKRGF